MIDAEFRSTASLSVQELISRLKDIHPLLLSGKFGERTIQAGRYFIELKKRCEHGEFSKLAKETGYSCRHYQKLMQIAKGVEVQEIPPDEYANLTFDKLYDVAVRGKREEARESDQAYWTPPELVDALLARETFPGPVWEPAVGEGRIASRFSEVLASDVKDWGFPGTRIADFLVDDPPAPFRSIVTNPPFRQLWKWTERAAQYRPEKMALLLPAAGLGDVAKVLPRTRMSLTRIILFRRPPKFVGPSGIADINWGAAWFVLTRGEGLPGVVDNV